MKLSIDKELDWFRTLAGGFSVFRGMMGMRLLRWNWSGASRKSCLAAKKKSEIVMPH